MSPEEQATFWRKLYTDALPVSGAASATVRGVLVESDGVVMNAAGRQPFGARWRDGVVVSAKTGSITDRAGTAVRGLVGHVAHQNRAFVFVSAVTGPPETTANAAIDLAAVKLHAARVL